MAPHRRPAWAERSHCGRAATPRRMRGRVEKDDLDLVFGRFERLEGGLMGFTTLAGWWRTSSSVYGGRVNTCSPSSRTRRSIRRRCGP